MSCFLLLVYMLFTFDTSLYLCLQVVINIYSVLLTSTAESLLVSTVAYLLSTKILPLRHNRFLQYVFVNHLLSLLPSRRLQLKFASSFELLSLLFSMSQNHLCLGESPSTISYGAKYETKEHSYWFMCSVY